MPIAKHAIKFLQIVKGRTGRLNHAAPFIPENILFQIEVLACSGHELPHASCFGCGDGLWVEGRFNEGQQGQLSGHVSAFEFFNNVKQIFPRALRHSHHVVGTRSVPIFAVFHQIIFKIGHGKALANAHPNVSRWLGDFVYFGLDDGRLERNSHFGWWRQSWGWCGSRCLCCWADFNRTYFSLFLNIGASCQK